MILDTTAPYLAPFQETPSNNEDLEEHESLRKALERLAMPSLWNALVGKHQSCTITVPETNIAPENRVSQEESSIPTIHFQVLCWFGFPRCILM